MKWIIHLTIWSSGSVMTVPCVGGSRRDHAGDAGNHLDWHSDLIGSTADIIGRCTNETRPP